MKKNLLFVLLAMLAIVSSSFAETVYRYGETVSNVRGDVIGGAIVTVYNANTEVKATIYSQNQSALGEKANPTYTDTYGRFFFYSDPGLYDVTISGTGITTYTIEDIRVWSAGADGVYNVIDYGAIAGDDEDDSVAIQATIDACLAGGGGSIEFPAGVFDTDTTLTVVNPDATVHVTLNLGESTILAESTIGAPVIRIGSSTDRSYNTAVNGGSIRLSSRNWSGTIGVQFYNMYYSSLDGIQVRGCEKGIELRAGDTGDGCVYNTLRPAAIIDCLWGIYLEHTLLGWTNENYFYGNCEIYYSSSLDAVDCSTGAAIYAKGISGGNIMNGNTFDGLSLECANSIANKPLSMDLDLQYSAFMNIRYEGFDTEHIAFGSDSHSNSIYGGYLQNPSNVMSATSETRVSVLTPKYTALAGGTSTAPVLTVHETNSYSNHSFVIMGTTGSEEFAINGEGTLILNEGPLIRAAGSGPEGIYPADSGSLFLKTDGTAYIKTSGTGNTGWQAISTTAASDPKYHQTWMMPITSAPSPAYIGGFYDFGASSNDFDPAVNWGITNVPAAAHFMIVTGATTVDEVTITLTGDRITDSTPVDVGYVDTIVIPSGTPADTYFETSSKWLGVISVETTSGTAVLCDYGWCKYWDNGNTAFNVVGGEAIWMGDNTSTIDIILYHHKTTGWTYTGSGPTPPTPLFRMSDVHGTNVVTDSNDYGCFKRVMPGDGTFIDGSASEGVLIGFTFTTSACIEYGQITLEYNQ